VGRHDGRPPDALVDAADRRDGQVTAIADYSRHRDALRALTALSRAS
jgi:hypothetical protein